MGYIRHHCIIVLPYDNSSAIILRNKAIEIFSEKIVTEIIYSIANGYYTFFIGPDGSKEGWDTSDEYDVKRKEYIDWLSSETIKNELYPKWCELVFYDEYNDPYIISHTDKE